MAKQFFMDYIEFSTGDLIASKKFFNEVFGWEFKDYGTEYASFSDGRLRGGFAQTAEQVGGGPLVVLHAPDLERMRDAVAAHGGTITVDVFEFPGGKRFHFREPGGNELSVWSE